MVAGGVFGEHPDDLNITRHKLGFPLTNPSIQTIRLLLIYLCFLSCVLVVERLGGPRTSATGLEGGENGVDFVNYEQQHLQRESRKFPASKSCCNCFGKPRRGKFKCLSRNDSSGLDEMSDVCPHEVAEESARAVIGPPGEEELKGRSSKNKRDKKEMIRMRSLNGESSAKEKEIQVEFQEYELADDAIDELHIKTPENDADRGVEKDDNDEDEDDFVRIGCDSRKCENAIGKEEQPVGVLNPQTISDDDIKVPVIVCKDSICRDKFATFPRMKRRKQLFSSRIYFPPGYKCPNRRKVPTRKTKDGTKIYYYCDATTNRPPSKVSGGILLTYYLNFYDKI